MEKRPPNSARASALQIALVIVFALLSVALVIAATYKLSPEMAPNQRWAATSSPPVQASQAPVALTPSTTALTQTLNVPEHKLTLRHPKDWSVGPKRFGNMTELVNIPSDQQGRVPITAKMKIRHQNRIDHADALGELVEISKETKTPVTFLTIGGWPAIQRASLEERQQPDEAPRFADPLM